MAPTILIVGATGNTGQETVRSLSKFIDTKPALSGYRLLAQTRSAKSSAAQQLAKVPHVEIVEYQWPEITADWLRQHEVVRAFIASHNLPNQFAEESTFHMAALRAGVKYVVRISTTAANVFPSCDAYYPRTHWAIEALLSTPDFDAMHWSSLQPNNFTPMCLGTASEMVKRVREGGEQGTLRIIPDEHTPVGLVHPDDVGRFAAQLLAADDTAAHTKARYVLNGPEDVTGAQIVALVEEAIGAKVKDVSYRDVSFVKNGAAMSGQSQNVMLSIRHALETTWAGKATKATTSKEVLELAPPEWTLAQSWKEALDTGLTCSLPY